MEDGYKSLLRNNSAVYEECCAILAVARQKLGMIRNVYKILIGKHERKRPFCKEYALDVVESDRK
jgi:hypothetical protein